jgi:hypothetical protein
MERGLVARAEQLAAVFVKDGEALVVLRSRLVAEWLDQRPDFWDIRGVVEKQCRLREVWDGESVPVERAVWLLLILVERDVDEGEVVHRERERYEPLGERIVLWKNFAHLKGEIADHAHRNHSNPCGTLA